MTRVDCGSNGFSLRRTPITLETLEIIRFDHSVTSWLRVNDKPKGEDGCARALCNIAEFAIFQISYLQFYIKCCLYFRTKGWIPGCVVTFMSEKDFYNSTNCSCSGVSQYFTKTSHYYCWRYWGGSTQYSGHKQVRIYTCILLGNF
jgi:hypothetical protein